jgi:hypothetical protein
MKIVKYLLAALLIITITKKVHVSPAALADELEFYDAQSKTAQMSNGSMYVGIMEYNKSTTPPNILIPSLKLFTQISTENYTTSSTPLFGGLNSMTSLYGIPVAGAPFHIKSNKTTIGTYWPINKVAQLQDGQTYVAIIEEQIGNYKKRGLTGRGPIWTQFDTDELSNLYNISTSDSNFQERVKKIGTVQKHKQQFTLYGVLLYPSNNQKSSKIWHTHSETIIPREPIVPGMDSFTKEMRDRVQLAYHNLLRKKDDEQSVNSDYMKNVAGLYAIPG